MSSYTDSIFMGLLLISALGLIYYAFCRMRARTVTILDAATLKAHVDSNVVCPGCGKRMTPGFVFAPRGVLWRRHDERAPRVLFNSFSNLLENTINMKMKVRENLAWRCEPCRLVHIDHKALVETR